MSPAPPLPTSESEADSLLASLRDHLATLSPSDSPLGLVSVLKQAQRLASSTIVHAKAQTAEVRLTLDKKTLDKMGLEYEKRRLTSEIQRCEDFDSIYETIPLQSSLAPGSTSHEQVLAALTEELAAMERFKSEKVALQRQGDVLARENKDTTARTAALDDALNEYAKAGVAIQNKMRDALPASAR